MLYEAIFIGIIVGWLRKGNLNNLAAIKISGIWLVFASFALQIGADLLWRRGVIGIYDYRLYLYGAAYLLLFLFLLRNWRLPGIKLLGLGFFLNFLVIMLNGGGMPVSQANLTPEELTLLKAKLDFKHVLLTEGTLLPYLADIMKIAWPYRVLFSLGDVLIAAGVFWLVVKSMTKPAFSTRLMSVQGIKMR